MKSKIGTNIFLVILVTLFSASGATAAGIGKNIVVLLAGEGLVDDSGNQFTQLDSSPQKVCSASTWTWLMPRRVT